MRIGVVSDTHNRMPNVERIVELFAEARVERIVHTGDITQAKVLHVLAELSVPITCVFGNNDTGERARLERAAARHERIELHDPPLHLEWAGRSIVVVHDPLDLTDVAAAPDLALHGHTHARRIEREGECLIFNPGECAGHVMGQNTVGVVDLVRLEPRLLFF